MVTVKSKLLTNTPIPALTCSGTPELAVTSPVHGLRPSGQPVAVPNSSCYLVTTKVAAATFVAPVRRPDAPVLRQLPESW